jgi:predicted transcriptional regulator
VGMIRRQAVEQLLAERGGKENDMVDLTASVEVAPIVIPPNMPLSFVYAVMSTMGVEYLPVVAQHGPIEGVVTRGDLVAAQNHKLDQFHIQDKIDELTHEVKDGNLIKYVGVLGVGGWDTLKTLHALSHTQHLCAMHACCCIAVLDRSVWHWTAGCHSFTPT